MLSIWDAPSDRDLPGSGWQNPDWRDEEDPENLTEVEPVEVGSAEDWEECTF